MNSKIIPYNSKEGVHLIPITVHPSGYTLDTHFLWKKILLLYLSDLVKAQNWRTSKLFSFKVNKSIDACDSEKFISYL